VRITGVGSTEPAESGAAGSAGGGRRQPGV
jgi:hypothetical protein